MSDHRSEADAWRENYYGMAERWRRCDDERLELKRQLADVELRLRLLRQEVELS